MFTTNIDVSDLAGKLALPVTGKEHDACPATDVLRRVGDKWSVLVVVLLGRGVQRYGELDRAIENISQRMLTRTLRNLERDGLVHRTTYPTVPVTVEYGLTLLGETLLGPISALSLWAVAHQHDIEAARAVFDKQNPGKL
ncbi:winged helix-turn-helix transcriptional regulator, partial [Frankia sp. AiPs1]